MGNIGRWAVPNRCAAGAFATVLWLLMFIGKLCLLISLTTLSSHASPDALTGDRLEEKMSAQYTPRVNVSQSRPVLNKPLYIEPQDGRWNFNPGRDTFSPQALLDLSTLNSPIVSPQHKICLTKDRSGFTLGSGEEIRFWAVNVQAGRVPKDEIDEQIRFLAKRGVNMVRLHTFLNPKNPKAQLEQADLKEIDQIHQYIPAMRKHGVYLTLSPYWAIHFKQKHRNPDWEIPRNPQANDFSHLLFFDPILQGAYKQWLKTLFNTKNPYTGTALKDEPALAIFQIQNEDSLLFWNFKSLQGADLDVLRGQYGRWLERRHGSLAAVKKHWGGAKPLGSRVPDDWPHGLVSFIDPWHSLQKGSAQGAENRIQDQLLFLTETMQQFNQSIVDYIRHDLGADVLINPGNWKTASAELLDDLERYSYSVGDVQGVNRYVSQIHRGKYANWALIKGQQYIDGSVLLDPLALPALIKQPVAAPFIISETGWISPISFQAEGPFLSSVYQSLNGVDATYWFTAKQSQWRQPSSSNGYLPSLGKWVVQTPMILGQFPAAAYSFRKGLVAKAEPIVRDFRPVKSMIQRVPPAIFERQGFDPNRDENWLEHKYNQNALAFLQGPVTVEYSKPKKSDKSSLMEVKKEFDRGKIHSVTKQILWDTYNGIVVLDTPLSQGSCGLYFGSQIFTQNISMLINNPYACIWFVSLDGKSLSESQNIFVQMGTRQFSTGWKTRPSVWEKKNKRYLGREIVEFGKAPWQIEHLDAEATIDNPLVSEMILLDGNGVETKRKDLTKTDSGRTYLRLPKSTIYAILK